MRVVCFIFETAKHISNTTVILESGRFELKLFFFSHARLIFFAVKNNIESTTNTKPTENQHRSSSLVSNDDLNDNDDLDSDILDQVLKSGGDNQFNMLNDLLDGSDLVLDNDKILSYFKIVEELKLDREQRDLVIFKKALYLIKISNTQEGYNLLKNLIEKNSKLKTLAEEIISK